MEEYIKLFDKSQLREAMKKEMESKVEDVLTQSDQRIPKIIKDTVDKVFQAPELDSLIVALIKTREGATEATKLAETERLIDEIKAIFFKECEKAGKAFIAATHVHNVADAGSPRRDFSREERGHPSARWNPTLCRYL